MFLIYLATYPRVCKKSLLHVRRDNLSQKETGDDIATYETLFVTAFTT